MAGTSRFYVVWKGKRPGIYPSWGECKAQIAGYKGAQYMAFASMEAARIAFTGAYLDYKGKRKSAAGLSAAELLRIGQPNPHSICVDAATAGNPGPMEYRGVDTGTRKILFRQGPFPEGTNNIGEFLAIVHGLAYLRERESDRILYSDSRIAIGWVRKKTCKSKLKPRPENKDLFDLIARAVAWLDKTSYNTPVVKWETRAWGEIPADYGRK